MAKTTKEQQRKADAKRAGARTRSWTAVVYPESAPEGWRDVIDAEHIEWIESPLHDRDVNPDGTPKKAHWHILLMFESVKTFEQVKEITDKLNAPIPQKCNGAKGLVRYMAHLDNPEKAQYLVSDIVGHGGADVYALISISESEEIAIMDEMLDWIDCNCVTNFAVLARYARLEKHDTWHRLLLKRSIYIKEYLKGVWRELQN